jgi:ribonucleoside-diphosphate reductase alpha chain
VDPARRLIWDSRKNKAAFEQKDVEFPTFWSDTAIKVVAQKYFKGPLGDPRREYSLKQLIDRVVSQIVEWAVKDKTITVEEGATLTAELTYMLLHQVFSFNSPVWFNVGTEFTSNPSRPQCSACFINSVDDTMDGDTGILSVYVREGKIFKDGSGSGINPSKLRSSHEFLSGGGRPSGPVSFMKGFDVNAGQIKSGGKTRRAAKMVILNVDHGNIVDFIDSKSKEEKKAHALIAAGYSDSFDDADGAYGSVFFQNENHSVRVFDEFMEAVTNGKTYWTKKRDGAPLHEYDANELMDKICQAAWSCGDPGIQFHDTINYWNPVAEKQKIWSSNPCSEYMFVDDSACNLASLNLMKFVVPSYWLDRTTVFNTASFTAAVANIILAMEVMVGHAGYPTPQIEQNSFDYRPLGLGYANLGALLMSEGMAYDSDEGRAAAGAITSTMSAIAYQASAMIAERIGSFKHFAETEQSFLTVIVRHMRAAQNVAEQYAAHLNGTAFDCLMPDLVWHWGRALELGRAHGYRNAQVTVLAPTGTIGFMMDCATTGVEPELGLIKHKELVGGGFLKLRNPEVRNALLRLGMAEYTADAIEAHIEEHGHVVGAPGLDERFYPIFDTSFGTGRTIPHMGHVRMLAAVQPFLSGAISKTVNMPSSATVSDIKETYIEGWKLGLKAIAIYRDGCKQSQPVSVKNKEAVAERVVAAVETAMGTLMQVAPAPPRQKLPDTRSGIVHKFQIGGHTGYMSVGVFPDTGMPAEIFLNISKEGSMVSGFADAFAIMTSFCLQAGVPLERLVEKFKHMSFEPYGWTRSPDVPNAKSIPDYIFRFLEHNFLLQPQIAGNGPTTLASVAEIPVTGRAPASAQPYKQTLDAPACTDCGGLMSRSGACYRCDNCGTTSGCS